jgi:flagellar hook-associated protein 2
VPTVQAAADASVTLGSGAGALNVTSSSNQINGVIPGVTVSLVAANPTENVTLTVAANTDNITKAIQGFVDSYNTVVQAANTATSFDSTTNTAGPLLGNGSLTDISNQLAVAITDVVPGLGQNLNNLASLGVTQNNDGTLSLDTSRLSQVLAGQVSGVSLNDVKNLFTLGGKTSNNGVQFTYATDKTLASGNNPYQLTITQAATQGSVTGLSPISFTGNVPPTVVITNSNNTFTISVNGHTSNLITIPQGSYTSAQLAQTIQSQINADTALGTNDVQVSINSGYLQIGSLAYGSTSSVGVDSGTALATLGLSAGQVSAGQDVAGYFTINGKTEAATGTGQELIGNSGNANTDGLQLLVTLNAAQVAASPTTNVTVTRGLASSLNQTLNNLTDPVNGRFLSIDQGFKDQIANIETTITNDNNLIQQQQDQLTAQFAALESQISQLKNIGNTITAQLNANTTNSSGFSQGL